MPQEKVRCFYVGIFPYIVNKIFCIYLFLIKKKGKGQRGGGIEVMFS